MSEVTNHHRIRVSATLRDNSGGGTAYAFALDQNPSIADITQKIKQTRLNKNSMTILGSFTTTATPLTADVTTVVSWDSLSTDRRTVATTSGLVSYNNTNPDAIVGLYHVFIYAVDPYKNTTVMAHPQNPIPMTTETIEITQALDFLSVGTTNYAEHHSNVSDATVELTSPLFDFYSGRTDKLYANISVDPKDSVVNDVSVVAFFSPQTVLSDIPAFTQKTNIYNNSTAPIFGTVKIEFTEVPLDNFFADTTDNTTGTSFIDHFTDKGYGQTFYVYVVMRDVGFDKWIVKEYAVSVGEVPVLTGSTAEIVVTV
jgi:hypothetical protein